MTVIILTIVKLILAGISEWVGLRWARTFEVLTSLAVIFCMWILHTALLQLAGSPLSVPQLEPKILSDDTNASFGDQLASVCDAQVA